MDEKNRQPYRSLFWPLFLIGVGVIWLLSNIGIIESFSFVFLLKLWPLALIAIGLDLMFGRRSPFLGALIGVGVVALVVALLLMAPDLDLDTGAELKTLSFSEALGEATSARIDLQLSRYPTTIDALEDSNALIEAELETLEDASFDAHGTSQKVIKLEPQGETNFIDWLEALGSQANWEIALSPDVPLDLHVDVGSGSAQLDLDTLTLERLDLDGGSGSTRLSLPTSTERYDVRVDGASGSFSIDVAEAAELEVELDVASGSFSIDIAERVDLAADLKGGSGSLTITIAENAEVDLSIDGASGSTTINVPSAAGVRVVVRDSGSGSVSVPGGYDMVSDGNDDDRDTGTWESENYADAEYRIKITFEGGSGSFRVR